MTTQTTLDFTSKSPINKEKLTGQNRLVYDLLVAGRKLTTFDAQNIGITALNSRVSDLRNKCLVDVKGKFITTGGGSKVMEYWID